MPAATHAIHGIFTGIGPNEGGDPRGALGAAIDATFGGIEQFRRQFAQAVMDVFGSGWVWLSRDGAGKLLIETTPGNDNPWMFGRKPILVFDVWEHAYYLKHQNRRAEAVEAWWNVVDWDRAEERFPNATGSFYFFVQQMPLRRNTRPYKPWDRRAILA